MFHVKQKSKRVEFLQLSLSIETEDCIPWPFSVSASGYGVVLFNGVSMNASRAICIMANGPPPKTDSIALHSPNICHNRLCLNKRHIRWGTYKENSADQVLDGTSMRGSNNPRAMLTDQQVLEIFKSIGTYSAISDRFPVSANAVGKIKRGENWSHITGAHFSPP